MGEEGRGLIFIANERSVLRNIEVGTTRGCEYNRTKKVVIEKTEGNTFRLLKAGKYKYEQNYKALRIFSSNSQTAQVTKYLKSHIKV